jgi:hypothetical protein
MARKSSSMPMSGVRRTCRHAPFARGQPRRLRQRVPVHLPVRRQRQLQQFDQPGRHHRGGQLGGQPVGSAGAPFAHDVADDAVLPDHGDGLPYPRQALQRRLDLAQLDPNPPDLHLVVGAPLEHQAAVVAAQYQVAGAVEPVAGARAERVGYEAFGGEHRPVQVPAAHPGSAHVQLTPVGRAQLVVQHVQLGRCDGAADRGWLAVRLAHGHARPDGRLGRTVHVDEAPPGRPAPDQLRGARLAGRVDPA